MERIETLPNTIETFVNIFDGAFKFSLLSCGELGGGDSVGRLILRML